MSADRVKWEHIHEFLNYVIEMFQRLRDDLKCTEELFREFYQRDHLDKIFCLSNFFTKILNNKILNNSANKNGVTPKLIIGLSQPIKMPSHKTPII